MRPLLIIEPGYRGHRMEFVELALRLGLADGRPVAAAVSKEGLLSEEWRSQSLSAGTDYVEVLPVLKEANSFHNRSADLRALAESHGGWDWFFPNVDEYVAALVMQARRQSLRRVRGVVMRPTSAKRRRGLMKTGVLSAAKALGAQLHPLESPLVANSRGSVLDPSGLRGSASELDFENEKASLINWIGSEPSSPVLCVAGVLDERKHIEVALELARRRTCRVLLVGKPSSVAYGTHLATSARAAGEQWVRANLTRVSEAQLDAAIAVSDCLLLLYSNVAGSSGLLPRAWRLGVPVVAWGNETVVAAVRRNNIGVVLPRPSPEAVTESLGRLPRPAPEDLEALAEKAENSWMRILRPTS